MPLDDKDDGGYDQVIYESAAADDRIEYPSRTSYAHPVTQTDTSRPSPEPPTGACDACRKMKIRCIDKENPPCKRCRHMKLQCRFAMPPMPRVVVEENEATKNRLAQLEGHVAGIFQKLDDMSSILINLGRPQAETPSSVSDRHLEAVSPRAQMASTHIYDRYQTQKRPGSAPLDHRPRSRLSTDNRPPSNASLPLSVSFEQTPWQSSEERFGLAPQPPKRSSMPEQELSPSDDEASLHDPLESAMHGEPFRDFTRHEEDVHLRKAGHDPNKLPLPLAERHAWKTAREKRRRIDSIGGHMPGSIGIGGELPHDDPWSPIRERGDPLVVSADPIAMGLVSEEDGARLFEAFMKNAHPFTPVFDPREDTFESLRKRSPFCITVIALIGLKQREAAGPASELTKTIQAEVEKMSKQTLFSPMATLETVQALAILISFSDNTWRLCCHAMALAVDMRLYRCLPYLHKIRTDSKQPNLLLERQRPLVVGARVWIALVRLAYEMSYNLALPLIFPPGNSTLYARELLDHPLSTLYDSRLVVGLEYCKVREPSFRPYESVATQDKQETDDLLRRVNHGIDAVYEYWLDYYRTIGLPSDHFLLIELSNQRAYFIMFTNSPAWYGVQTREDVKNLSPERLQWVSAATRAAAFLVQSIANKRLEKDSAFGNHNFYCGSLLTARYLIRMCELLPDVCDRFEVSLDIDRLLIKFPYYPVRAFLDGLRRTLAKAREQGILPYTHMSDAASKGPAPSPQSDVVAAAVAEAAAQLPGFNPFPWHDPVHTAQPIPQLDSAGLPMDVMQPPNPPAAGAWADSFDLAAWFPAADDPIAALPVDGSALDADMANWFPAAPQVWLGDS